MSKQTYRTWGGFRFFLAGFFMVFMSIPYGCGITLSLSRDRIENEFLKYFLLPTIGFSVIVISFVLFSLGSRKRDQS